MQFRQEYLYIRTIESILVLIQKHCPDLATTMLIPNSYGNIPK